MSFKQLAVRTKKSISGLYSSSNDQEAIGTQASDRNIDNIHKLRESPSRRKRLIGSFRSLRHPSTKMGVESPVRTDSPRTPVRGFPSLALNFEASPPGRPMFDTSTRKTSPITMPMANAPTAISSR
ncbi:hypothetical protein CC80DRAFT_307344 [Byssothecium circinans]|uniref:Uncharacterized protein n=1 Tax=Byssothecium circinans TaxID=147558 RepID=A0A6A5U9V1_9PLEO|nr:hypothetical protein CC80DRAFT_307344 [Byssothecium circinans]